ncbi:hypothetical protein [Citrobacter freundii]|uniref:hypothetical protein n=1 Tax=Citrobacter freundii TaxID=546 RepID=UPI00300D15AE
MSKKFYLISELASSSIEVSSEIIQLWLKKELPLYAYFDGKHPACTFRRCISYDEHHDAISDIMHGRDQYQHPDIPETEKRLFVPETPLDAHLKIKPTFQYGGLKFIYKYRGKAFGYWRVKPTQKARVCSGNYLTGDCDAIDFKPETLGDVSIHSDTELDFLVFLDDYYIDKNDFYVSSDDLEIMNDKIKNVNASEENNDDDLLDLDERDQFFIAFYLIIYGWSTNGKKDKKIPISKLVMFYNDYINFDVDKRTIREWAKKPSVTSSSFKSYRDTSKKREGFYHLLKQYCSEKGINAPTLLSDELNKLSEICGYSQYIKFDKSEVNIWFGQMKSVVCEGGAGNKSIK